MSLVTGGSGFIGSHLVKALTEKGEKVISLAFEHPYSSWLVDALSGSTIVRGDVRDQHFLKRVISQYRIKTVFHLAAQAIVKKAIREPVNTYDVNVMGAVQVLESCRQLNVENVIVQSSDKVYGDQELADVSSPLIPTSPYETSKIAEDVIAQSYAKTYGMNVTITRPCNCYGLDDEDRIVPNTIRACMEGRSPTIFKGDHGKRQYIYVADLVSALIHLKDMAKYRNPCLMVANIATDDLLDQEQVVLRILEFFPDINPEYVEPKSIKEIRSQSIILTDFGWKPKYDFEHGINKTLELWRKYFP